jgi:hypothetical protein
MFRPSSGLLQGVHIKYICIKCRRCVNKIKLKLGFDVIRWLEGCIRDRHLMKCFI